MKSSRRNDFLRKSPKRDAIGPRKFKGLEPLEPRYVLTGVYISEFMANNASTLADGDGEFSDWIEIHNPTGEVVDLAGWHLTDKSNDLEKWTFPSTSTIAPDEYLVVFASGQESADYVDADGNLHTTFKLKAGGEYLGLTDPDENIISHFAPEYPPQLVNVAYGWESIESFHRNFIDEGSATTVWVPENGDLEPDGFPTWAQPQFDDSQWLSPEEFVPDPNLEVTVDGLSDSDITICSRTAAICDDRLTTVLTMGSNEPVTLRIPFGATAAIEQYTVSVPDTGDGRSDPYSWTLTGIKNSAPWFQVIDSRDMQQFERGETRQYEFVNDQAFDSYRFEFFSELLFEPVRIAELELIDPDAPWTSLHVSDQWSSHESSLYQRFEFDWTPRSDILDREFAVGSLRLQLIDDGGFVVYLNGTRVSVTGASEPVGWQSRAFTNGTDSPTSIPLTQFADLLVDGTNVLGLHRLYHPDSGLDRISRPILSAQFAPIPEEFGFIVDPSPRSHNATVRSGFAVKPTISQTSGFYDDAIQISITSPTPDSTIYYSTDGSVPGPINGRLYEAPITVSSTTTLRAATFRSDLHDSEPSFASYIFVKDVVSQPLMKRDLIGEFDETGEPLGGRLLRWNLRCKH